MAKLRNKEKQPNVEERMVKLEKDIAVLREMLMKVEKRVSDTNKPSRGFNFLSKETE